MGVVIEDDFLADPPDGEGEEITTTHDGQIIEGKVIKRLVIRHKNITVRNCKLAAITDLTDHL